MTTRSLLPYGQQNHPMFAQGTNGMPTTLQQCADPEEWRPGVVTRMLVSARTGATQLCIFEQWVDPGAGAPLHDHPVEEVLRVLAGLARVTLNGETVLVGAGQAILAPPLSAHAFVNDGPVQLHLQVTLASAVFEARRTDTGEIERRWQGKRG